MWNRSKKALEEAKAELNATIEAAKGATDSAKQARSEFDEAYTKVVDRITAGGSDAAKALAGKKMWSDPELILDQWNKYELIAMHFNDLTMRFRTQALAALATVSAFATLAGTAKGDLLQHIWAFFAFLAVLWAAAWLLDARYYSKLLEGAVEALVDFEAQTASHIGMSTRIKCSSSSWRGTVNLFYGLIEAALILVTVGAHCFLKAPSSEQPLALPITFTVDGRSVTPPVGGHGAQPARSASPPQGGSAGSGGNSSGGSASGAGGR